MMLHGRVCPIIPWRDANLTGQFIDAVDCSTAVTSGNHQLIVYGTYNEFFPFTVQLTSINLLLLHQLVYRR